MSGTAVSFLSGKGGSGKTTLALSIADLLSCSGVSTLLIDCDLSTNGATYFFESLLSSQNAPDSFAKYILVNKDNNVIYDKSMTKKYAQYRYSTHYDDSVLSSYDDSVLSSEADNNAESKFISTINIKPNYDFIPSFFFTSDHMGSLPNKETLDQKLTHLVKWATTHYDVVLFDCQAGYTDLLLSLLPLMNVDLFVLEADSISASSMRNLHLKIGHYFGDAKLYQVFNKASDDEYKIYSKITGTFFTNIGTLLFDWKIRQAFSRSEMPDLENTSSRFGSDLCDICKIIFMYPSIKTKINSFSNLLLIKQTIEERDQAEKELKNLTKNSNYSHNKYIGAVMFLFVAPIALLFGYIFIKNKTFFNQSLDMQIISIASASISLFGLLFSYITILSSSREERKLRRSYYQTISELDHKIQKLQKESNVDKDE